MKKSYKVTSNSIKHVVTEMFNNVFNESVPSRLRCDISDRLYDPNVLAYFTKWKNGTRVLKFRSKYSSYNMFKQIAVHEVVHLWQDVHKKRDHHGKSFWMWNDKIKNVYGFELKKDYDEQ